MCCAAVEVQCSVQGQENQTTTKLIPNNSPTATVQSCTVLTSSFVLHSTQTAALKFAEAVLWSVMDCSELAEARQMLSFFSFFSLHRARVLIVLSYLEFIRSSFDSIRFDLELVHNCYCTHPRCVDRSLRNQQFE